MSFRAHSTAGPASRALLRAAIALSAAGAALATGAGAAQANQLPGVNGMLGGALQSVGAGIGPVKHLRLDPMADTTVDPLTNAVGTQVADFQPVGTEAVTKPLADGDSLSQLPLIGRVSDILPG